MDARDTQSADMRSRAPLIVTILVLLILLIATAVYLWFALRPIGAPTRADLPEGITWIRSIYGWGEAKDQQFHQPTDASIGPDGTIWGTDPARARLLGFNPDGTLRAIIENGPPGSGRGRMQKPEGIEVDARGHVYVADFGNSKVLEFDSSGAFVDEWNVPSPLDVATSSERIVVSTVFGVAFFDLEGNLETTWGTRGRGDGQFDVARGVALSDEGTLFVSDTQNSRVHAYNDRSEPLWVTDSTPGRGPFSTPSSETALEIPAGMTLDGSGRIVLVDPFLFAIAVLDPATGEVLDTYGEFGAEDGRFIYPTGIDYDEDRDWFVVADTANDRLQVVRIPGSGGDLASEVRAQTTGWAWLWAIPFVVLLLALAWKAWRRFLSRHKDSKEV